MEPSPLQDRVKRVPFVPFTVTMSNGREVQVSTPEMVILGRRWDLVGFVDQDGYDRLVIVYHHHINTIDAYDPIQSGNMPG